MAAQAGDQDAFVALLDGAAGQAYRLARVIVRDDLMAQDAVQEASIRAWRDLPRLRDPEKWPQWYRRIAVRAAIDQARREAGERHLALDPLPASRADASESIARRDELAVALRRLSPDDRALLALRFAADLEVPDIAEALGIPLGTAKSRLHRALAKLRTELEADR